MVLRAVREEEGPGRGGGGRGTEKGGGEGSEEKKGRSGKEDMCRSRDSKGGGETGDG